jgi:uncharacterized protein (TIGR02246 family)
MRRLLAAMLAAGAASATAAEVTVIRPKSIIADEWPFYVFIGNQARPVADLQSGERVTFQVPAEARSIVVHCPKVSAIGYDESRVDYDFKANARAFFVISPSPDCVSIEALDARAAAPHISATRNRLAGRRIDYEATQAPESIAMAATAAALAKPEPTAAGPQQQVAAATAAWAEAFNSRDASRLSGLYEAQATLNDGAEKAPRVGATAIADYYAAAVKRKAQRVALGEHSIRLLSDSVAIDSGTLTYYDMRDGSATTTPGRYSLTYQNRGGKWLIVDHHTSTPR